MQLLLTGLPLLLCIMCSGSSLSSAFDTDIDASSFFRLLCAAHGTGWSVSWS